MVLKEICSLVNGVVICGNHRLEESSEFAFASDLMSDVLTIKRTDFLLLTGLANIQSIRTAEMSDLSYLILCRGKKSTEDMIELAADNDLVLIESPMSLFQCAGILYGSGLKPIF